MKQDNLRPVKIPAAEARQLTRWELPLMDAGVVDQAFQTVSPASQVTVVEEEIEVEKLTLAEIEQIREDAVKEGFAQGREEGFAQGLAAGERQGYEQGLESGLAEIQRQQALLMGVCQALANPVAAQEQELERLLTGLVQGFARAVIDAELQSNPEPICQAVRAALAELPGATLVCDLRVNPADLPILQALPGLDGVRLIEDPSIEQGGCSVTTDNTRIDHRVSTRFQQITEQLAAALGQSPASVSRE